MQAKMAYKELEV